MKIKFIEIESMENAGCNNGNYPGYRITLENGEQIMGITCNCGKGCAETDFTAYNIGDEYKGSDY
jgi:hypothetical protein